MRKAGRTTLSWTAARAILLAVAVLLFHFPAHAEDIFEHLHHKRWIADDEGPSQVGALARTQNGYLWLSTNDSLYRFDGFRFARFEPDGKNTLGIVSTLLSVGDTLWVGLRQGGVAQLAGGNIRLFQPGPELPAGVIYSLAQDRNNAIWAAADDGLARFDGTRWQTVGERWKFPGRKSRAVFVDRQGTVWAASGDGLFYLPDGAHEFVDSGLKLGWASHIAQAADNAIWISERYTRRIHRLQAGTPGKTGKTGMPGIEITSASTSTPVTGMYFDRDGHLWLSTSGDGILYLAQPASLKSLQTAQRYAAPDGLSSSFAWKVLGDEEGNLWVGTNGGLDRFRPRVFMRAGFPEGALNFALAADGEGNVWGGPNNFSAMRLHDNGVDFQAMPAPVTSAMRDREGGVWMGGPSGIWRVERGRLERVAALPAATLSESSVRAMARDKVGGLWVSLNRVGLFRYAGGQWQAIPPPSDHPLQAMPVIATSDEQGRLWFGYRENLLLRKGEGGEQRWDRSSGMDIGHVTALAHQGGLTFVGGQRGMGYIRNDTYRKLNVTSRSLFENIYAIIPVESQAGQVDLWIQSRAGIFQITSAELQQAMANSAYQPRYRSYDLMGGLANDPYQILPLPTAIRSDDGRLWFSTSDGVVWINPQSRLAQQPAPKILIESVSADGALLDKEAPVRLDDATKRIVIDYTALSLSAPERLSFRYRLDGHDTQWQDVGRQRQAVYTSLRPGHYRFRVIAHNKDGLPSTEEATFGFQVLAPLYTRPEVLGALFVLAALLVWLVSRAGIRRATQRLADRLEERQHERERIARELHDTLLQGVQGLMLHFQAARDRIPPSVPGMDKLDAALDHADDVIAEGRDRVRNLRGNGAVTDLQQRLCNLASEFSTYDRTVLRLREHGRREPLRPLILDEIYCITREAISNAFTHAAAAEICVDIFYTAQAVVVRVQDDGQGMSARFLTPEGRFNHWGLRGMHERARQIGARLKIDSLPAWGTTVTLSVDAALAYGERQSPRRGLHKVVSKIEVLSAWRNRKAG